MKMLSFALALAIVASFSVRSSAAESQWAKEHPRRHQVNKRLNNQNKRIKQGVKNGTLTKQQARQLHQEDKNIRQEERAMAAQNGGHITKAEQRSLNQQENQTSKQIDSEKRAGAAPAASGQ